jgi:phospholipid/cholesterol/gamma-HCH transport system ATP-binding protein
MHTLPPNAQQAILDDLEGTHKLKAREFADEEPVVARHSAAVEDESPTASIPAQREA